MPPLPSVAWGRIFSDVKLYIPGSIDAVIQQELWAVVADFTDATNMWTEEIPINVNPNQRSYPVTPAGKGQVDRLMLVYDPKNAAPDKRWVQSGIQFRMPGFIDLSYAPSSATVWNAVVAKTLIDPPNSDNYPDMDLTALWIPQNYRDTLTQGVLARMYAQPAKPCSNAQLARRAHAEHISGRSTPRG